MDKYNKEIEQTLLNNEKAMLKQLETTYVKALADVKGRLRLLQAREETQSVIYQINYQKSLESQINAILGVLKQDNITNVQDFLNHMYEDGYLGVQYSLMQQGVPVITAINQEEVSKSLFKQLGHMTFADRLNVNMNDFKTKIKDTITRGLASATTYRDMANQLSLITNEELYKSYRIARTEGHRITAEAKLNSMKKAKQQGADVVKQWDATLDGKTRKNHRKLDGEWVEVDEYFEIGGRKVKAPGKFGRAEEDINCRCILLTRPRWAVDKTRTKSAKIKDEYGEEVEKLINVKNYDDYKKGYYRVLEEDPEIEKVVKEANKRIANMKGNVKKVERISIKNIDDCKQLMNKVNFNFDTNSLQKLDFELVKENTEQLHNLVEKYPFVNNHKRQDFTIDAKPQNSLAYTNGFGIHLNSDYYQNYNEVIKKEIDLMKKGYSSPFKEEYASVATLTHEYGHMICNELVKKYYDDNPEIYKKSLKDINSSNKVRKKIIDDFIKEIKDVAKAENKDVALKISEYGRTNSEEMFAELFMKSQLGKSDEFSDALLKWLEGKTK